MSDNDLGFDADEFLSLSKSERARLCRALAHRAQQLADKAGAPYRDAYAEIARQWRELADELEKI
jgi:hypothetical protein